MVRPHVVVPDQLPADFHKALLESFPGTGEAYFPIDPANWITVTDGMYQVTQPGMYHTAGADGLRGIDFGGKTGTAQVISHQALDKTSKGRSTNPNVWFVGVTPTRNPELVVAVLWQNGGFSYYPARIGARVVAAYIEKQRRLAHNLVEPAKADTPAEMSAVWTVPNPNSSAPTTAQADRLQTGHFLVDHGQIVPAAPPTASAVSSTPSKPTSSRAPSLRVPSVTRVGNHGPEPAHTPAQPPPSPQPALAVSGKGR
jgi:penicillin-binding protein 2